MTDREKCEKCKGIGYINDEYSGTLICECTFRKAGFGVKHVYSNGTQMGELGKAILNKDCPVCKGTGFLEGPRGVLRCYCRDKTPASKPDKTYIGDGVYVEAGHGEIILTTENGVATANRIYMDVGVIRTLVDYLKTKGML